MAEPGARERLPDLNGLLAIDKPAGWTSHDVVARVRRLVGMKRVGHAGTLDPFATGLLVVGVGRATRMLQYVQDGDKGYRATIVLGVETDTLDVDGSVVRRYEAGGWPDGETVTRCLRPFIGEIEQRPPAHAAIKVGGRKLYELARAGQAVEVPPRKVRIDALDLEAYAPPVLTIGVRCGKGTYIRSLARDIGEALGTGAYCHALRRTNVGTFCLADAWALDELAARDLRADWPAISLHPDRALASLQAIVLNGAGSDAWYHGRPVALPACPASDASRVYDRDGNLAGIGAIDEVGRLRPVLVLPPPVAGGDVPGRDGGEDE